jgi:general stress protein 26
MTKSPDEVWDLIKDIRMALLVTKDEGRLDARPMSATAKPEEGCIYILANKGEDSDRQIQAQSEVILSFQKGATTYIVVHGRAQASDDRAKIRQLWNAFDKAWWDGPEDRRIRLLTIMPDRAEYWESPGKLIAYTDMLVAAATGGSPSTGEHGKTSL